MLSVDVSCMWDANTPFASSYDGGGGILSAFEEGVVGASIRCLSDTICRFKEFSDNDELTVPQESITMTGS